MNGGLPTSSENALFEAGADALDVADFSRAEASFRAYLEHCPGDADALYNLGLALHGQGDTAAATQAWIQAAQSGSPELVQPLYEAADDLLNAKNFTSALQLYAALPLNDGLGPHLCLRRCWCLHQLGADRQALEVLELGLKRWPRHLGLKLQQMLLLPMLYTSAADMRWWREHLLRCLSEVEQWLSQPQELELGQIRLPSPIFDLMSQGEDEKELLMRISALWQRIFVPPQPPLDLAPATQGRIKLAIVSVSVYNHSTMHYFLGMLELLAQQSDFETCLIYLGDKVDDFTGRIRLLVDCFVQLPMDILAGAEALSQWGPELIFYLDIGQEALLYSLAHLRLARVQCVSAGVPITTGIANMDYYISSRWFEPPEAQAYYSERLVLLERIMVCMRPPPVNDPLRSRQDFGLREDSHVYIFPHSLFRVDPELDPIFAEILLQDPQAEIVFVKGQGNELHTQLQKRFGALYPDLLPRLRFFEPMLQADYLNLIALSDVALDSLRLGGGNVSFQCFWVGTPVIQLPTRFLRCRIASGLYKLAGLEEWIATDREDYLAKALRLGTDPELRAELSAGIRLAAREKIFNQADGILETFDWFRRVTRPDGGSHLT